MKKMFKMMALVFLFSLGSICMAQTGAKELSKDEINQVFTAKRKVALGITFPIFKTFEYLDKGGVQYVVFTEKKYTGNGSTAKFDSIKCFNVKVNASNKLEVVWQCKDFRSGKSNTVSTTETSIWCWTKYCQVVDIDGDGYVDPIIVYGTSGDNGTDDGRVKILTYYKGKKYAIRHQNGTLDHQRKTQVDKSVYSLPTKIQVKIKAVMKKIETGNHAIFPGGWEEAMKKQKLIIKE